VRIASIAVLTLAALGFGAATAVIRNAPAEEKLLYSLGALSVPIILMILGLALGRLGARRPRQ
jgi:predicted permease